MVDKKKTNKKEEVVATTTTPTKPKNTQTKRKEVEPTTTPTTPTKNVKETTKTTTTTPTDNKNNNKQQKVKKQKVEQPKKDESKNTDTPMTNTTDNTSTTTTTNTTPTVSSLTSIFDAMKKNIKTKDVDSTMNADVTSAFSSSNTFEEAPQPKSNEEAEPVVKPEAAPKKGPHGKPELSKEEKEKRQAQDLQVREEQAPRTLFVSNVDINTTPKELKAFFNQYGKVVNCRLRSIAIGTEDANRKDTYINKKFNQKRESCNAYVLFATEADAKKSLIASGALFKDKHISVDLSSNKHEKGKDEKTVFVGNVPYESENEEIFQVFDHSFGGVESVRLVRDKHSGKGKGFGYVTFMSKKNVKAALKEKQIQFNDRYLRIFPNKENPKGKNVGKKNTTIKPSSSNQPPALKKNTPINKSK